MSAAAVGSGARPRRLADRRDAGILWRWL